MGLAPYIEYALSRGEGQSYFLPRLLCNMYVLPVNVEADVRGREF